MLDFPFHGGKEPRGRAARPPRGGPDPLDDFGGLGPSPHQARRVLDPHPPSRVLNQSRLKPVYHRDDVARVTRVGGPGGCGAAPWTAWQADGSAEMLSWVAARAGELLAAAVIAGTLLLAGAAARLWWGVRRGSPPGGSPRGAVAGPGP